MRNPLFQTTRTIASMFAALVLLCATTGATATETSFDTWLSELVEEARSRGFSQTVIDVALSDLQPIDEILAEDRSQPSKPIVHSRARPIVPSDTAVCENDRVRKNTTPAITITVAGIKLALLAARALPAITPLSGSPSR